LISLGTPIFIVAKWLNVEAYCVALGR
jgi:hypothetical protein